MTKHRNSQDAHLTARNVTKALISAIEFRELSLVDWQYIKETIDTKYDIKEEIQESFAANRFIKWLFGV